MMPTLTGFRGRSPVELAVGSGCLALVGLLAAVGAYIEVAEPTLTGVRTLAYPALWITGSVGTAVWIGLTVRGRPRRRRGVVVAAGYTLALLWLTGLIGAPTATTTAEIVAALPGWGPLLLYDGTVIRLAVVPFKLVAYLALGYIVYVFVAANGGSVRAAVLGFATCVGCGAPLLVAVAGGLGSAQAATLVASVGYDIATVVLGGTFGLLALAASRQATAECSPTE